MSLSRGADRGGLLSFVDGNNIARVRAIAARAWRVYAVLKSISEAMVPCEHRCVASVFPGVIRMAEIGLGSCSMSDHDVDWFRVIVSIEGVSQRKLASDAIRELVERSKSDYVKRVEYAARKHGLTFDEAFHRLRRAEPLGDPLEDFVVVPEMEGKLNGLTQK